MKNGFALPPIGLIERVKVTPVVELLLALAELITPILLFIIAYLMTLLVIPDALDATNWK
jgi:hypothetical protein